MVFKKRGMKKDQDQKYRAEILDTVEEWKYLRKTKEGDYKSFESSVDHTGKEI